MAIVHLFTRHRASSNEQGPNTKREVCIPEVGQVRAHTPGDWSAYWTNWVGKYPPPHRCPIEDGMAETTVGLKTLTRAWAETRRKRSSCGDDLFVTNTERLSR